MKERDKPSQLHRPFYPIGRQIPGVFEPGRAGGGSLERRPLRSRVTIGRGSEEWERSNTYRYENAPGRGEAKEICWEGRAMAIKREKLNKEQEAEILKLFKKSKTMKSLTQDFIKSFKVLEERTTSRGRFYIIWSSILNQTLQIPVQDLLKPEDAAHD